MSTPSPYLRTFTVGLAWFCMIALTMVSRHPGHWSTYPPRNLMVLVAAWLITALWLGVIARRFQKLSSWVAVSLGTVGGSIIVLWLMLIIVQRIYGVSPPPKFKNHGQMMAYLANETTRWVKKDRNIDLDYSVDSIKIVEEELGRISKEINRANPEQGTFGIAIGYGAYIGEVFRRREGGSWALDHPVAGARSYPLTIRSNETIFPVGWCWKRLTAGEEDNVYHKALLVCETNALTPDSIANDAIRIP